MSAILALWNRDGRPVDPATVDTMLAASGHRAVDGQNVYIDGCVALAHQHFWLTPEEQGEIQPIIDKETGLVITCDARLDDRDTLQNKLAVDKSQNLSDVQLVLRAFKRWGEACVDHLLGDFAFAIWRSKEKNLFVARDAMGVRDLCYFDKKDCYVLASELLPILALPGMVKKINEKRLADYFLNRWTDFENTYYENIAIWRPGYCGTISETQCKLRQYWELKLEPTVHHNDGHEYAIEFRNLLQACVRDRMRIQADIAIAMSGGLDSTSVAALAMALKQDKGLHAVSWVFNEYPECDERDTIKKVAEHIGIDSVYIDGDELWPLSDPSSWPVIKESPVQNPFIRLTVEAARTGASAGCRAIFSGSRSDALMLGSRYWGIESLRQCGMNRFLGYLFSSDQAFQDSKKILRQLIGPLTPQLVKNVLRSVLRANKHSQLAALDREFLERMQLKENQAPAAITSPFAFNRLQRRNILEVAIGAQVGAFGRLLTNKHGIEYLDPFQDRRLFEYVLAVPAYVLGRPPYPKLLLRNAMTDVLPKQIVWSRDRVTLNSFYQKSMLQKARLTILELLTEPMVIKKGFISRSWIDQMRAWFQAGEKMSVMSESLWPILCVELWLRKYWNQ